MQLINLLMSSITWIAVGIVVLFVLGVFILIPDEEDYDDPF